jgi:hypothetical protein
MSTTIRDASQRGARGAVNTIETVDQLKGDLDTAKIFLKLVKKAEEAAQAGT